MSYGNFPRNASGRTKADLGSDSGIASSSPCTAVEALLGEPAAYDVRAIPAVVFTDPEVAWCGLMEHEAVRDGREVKTAIFPWVASGRAATSDER